MTTLYFSDLVKLLISILDINLDDKDEDDVRDCIQNSRDADSILVKERALKLSVEQLDK